MKKLSKHKSVKLTQTVSGQREILREHTNKINEIVGWINDSAQREDKVEADESFRRLDVMLKLLKDE